LNPGEMDSRVNVISRVQLPCDDGKSMVTFPGEKKRRKYLALPEKNQLTDVTQVTLFGDVRSKTHLQLQLIAIGAAKEKETEIFKVARSYTL